VISKAAQAFEKGKIRDQNQGKKLAQGSAGRSQRNSQRRAFAVRGMPPSEGTGGATQAKLPSEKSFAEKEP
jgi:hypothetical protein